MADFKRIRSENKTLLDGTINITILWQTFEDARDCFCNVSHRSEGSRWSTVVQMLADVSRTFF